MVIAHHHLSWLQQKQSLEDHLGDVAPIQVFGHIHTNRVTMNRDFIRLTAGATHPDRYEKDWEPGYNFIGVSVVRMSAERSLHVRAHVRIWQKAPGGFYAKRDRNSDVFEHWIKLDPWEASNVVDEPLAASPEQPGGEPPAPTPRVEDMSRLRDPGVRFLRADFQSEVRDRQASLTPRRRGYDPARFRAVQACFLSRQ